MAAADEIVTLGEEIYDRQYREQYERERPGMFVAIDVDSEVSYIAGTPEAALHDARSSSPHGRFHVIHVRST